MVAWGFLTVALVLLGGGGRASMEYDGRTRHWPKGRAANGYYVLVVAAAACTAGSCYCMCSAIRWCCIRPAIRRRGAACLLFMVRLLLILLLASGLVLSSFVSLLFLVCRSLMLN